MCESCTKLPQGSQTFYEAVERLRNAGPNCNNKFELAQYCCTLCKKDIDCDCEACYVQTVGDLYDPYRKKIQEGTPTGMYSSGIYKDERGKFHYSHPQGSG